MRIAYVTVHVAPEIMQGGVGKKIKSQVSIWHEQGHEAALFSLTPAELSFPDARQFNFETRSRFKLLRLLEREIKRSVMLKRMFVSIQQYHPDIIYLRFGLYSYPLHALFKIAPVVLETNSNDVNEYRKRGLFFYWMNLLTRNLTIDPACGVIVPSFELAQMLFPDSKKNVVVISNGIDLKDTEVLPPAHNKFPVITLVGSPGMAWHGVDKLINFARTNSDLVVNIVGYSKKDIEIDIPANVRLHGFLSKDKVREILLNTDVACGSLAIHRNDMEEASVLKIREALAYGIPVLIAYRDTDLHQVDLETILHIPNTEDNLLRNAERIRKFAYDMMGRRVPIESVAPYLDQRLKENTRLDFFQKIIKLKSR